MFQCYVYYLTTAAPFSWYSKILLFHKSRLQLQSTILTLLSRNNSENSEFSQEEDRLAFPVSCTPVKLHQLTLSLKLILQLR